jgi:hypothetical protein
LISKAPAMCRLCNTHSKRTFRWQHNFHPRSVISATMDGQSSERRKEIQSLSFRIPVTAKEEILKEAQLKIYASIHNRRRSYYGEKSLLQVSIFRVQLKNHSRKSSFLILL